MVIEYNSLCVKSNNLTISRCGSIWGRFRAPPVADAARIRGPRKAMAFKGSGATTKRWAFWVYEKTISGVSWRSGATRSIAKWTTSKTTMLQQEERYVRFERNKGTPHKNKKLNNIEMWLNLVERYVRENAVPTVRVKNKNRHKHWYTWDYTISEFLKNTSKKRNDHITSHKQKNKN